LTKIIGLNNSTDNLKLLNTFDLLQRHNVKLTGEQVKHIDNLGVKNRYIKHPDVKHIDCLLTPAYGACTKSNMGRSDIDNIIVASEISDYQSPGLAPMILSRLNLRRTIPYYNLQGTACSSIFRIIELAKNLKGNTLCVIDGITSDMYQTALSQLKGDIKPKSAEWVKLCFGVLFGDAAAAFVVTHDKVTTPGWVVGQHKHVVNLDPDDYKKAAVTRTALGNYTMYASSKIVDRALAYAEVVKAHMHRNYLDGFDKVFLHTGSKHILDAFKDRYAMTYEQLDGSYYTLENYGNTTGCSIPLAMTRFNHTQGTTGLLLGITMGFGVDMMEVRYE